MRKVALVNIFVFDIFVFILDDSWLHEMEICQKQVMQLNVRVRSRAIRRACGVIIAARIHKPHIFFLTCFFPAKRWKSIWVGATQKHKSYIKLFLLFNPA